MASKSTEVTTNRSFVGQALTCISACWNMLSANRLISLFNNSTNPTVVKASNLLPIIKSDEKRIVKDPKKFADYTPCVIFPDEILKKVLNYLDRTTLCKVLLADPFIRHNYSLIDLLLSSEGETKDINKKLIDEALVDQMMLINRFFSLAEEKLKEILNDPSSKKTHFLGLIFKCGAIYNKKLMDDILNSPQSNKITPLDIDTAFLLHIKHRTTAIFQIDEDALQSIMRTDRFFKMSNNLLEAILEIADEEIGLKNEKIAEGLLNNSHFREKIAQNKDGLFKRSVKKGRESTVNLLQNHFDLSEDTLLSACITAALNKSEKIYSIPMFDKVRKSALKFSNKSETELVTLFSESVETGDRITVDGFINFISRFNINPFLKLTVEKGYVKSVKVILDSSLIKNNSKIRKEALQNILSLATKNGHLEIVTIITDSKSYLDEIDTLHLDLVLYDAIEKGYEKIAEKIFTSDRCSQERLEVTFKLALIKRYAGFVEAITKNPKYEKFALTAKH